MDELQIGELVDTQWGVASVQHVEVINEPQAVYNLEIAGQHVFRIGKTGVLVHNADPYEGAAPNSAAVKDLWRSESAARKALNRDMGVVDGFVNHHVIPVSLRRHGLIESAADGGWFMNRDISNGYRFRKNPFHPKGSTHPRHTKELSGLLDNLNDHARALKLSDSEKAQLVQNLVDDLRKGFDRNLTGNLNNTSLRDLLPNSWHSFLD